MKVCLVYSSGFSTIRGGGIATKLQNIVKETVGQIDYTILTTVEEADYPELNVFKTLGINVINVSSCGKSIGRLWKVFSQISKSRFDVIHFQELPFVWDIKFSLLTILLFKRLFTHSSFVYEHQIATLGNLNRFHLAFQYVIFKAFFPFWDKIVVNSQCMKNEVYKLVSSHSKVVVLPLGIDVKGIQQASTTSLGDNALLFFGHISRIKGVDVLLEAFKKISEQRKGVSLFIVGNGDYEKYCKNYVTTQGLSTQIHFLDAQMQNTLFSIVKGAAICVLPSRNDSGPLSVLESMAAGKPVITTSNVGVVPELLINGKNGLLVNCAVDDIASAILFLLDHPEDRLRMGANNAEVVKKYSWDNVAKKYVSLYKSVLKTCKTK